MDVIVGVLAVVWIAVCCAALVYVVHSEKPKKEKSDALHSTLRDTVRRDRDKEAFYMRNFWSYDGTEQEEFEE